VTQLEDLKPGLRLTGILPGQSVVIVDVRWHGTTAVELVYKRADGQPGTQLLFRGDEAQIAIDATPQAWQFDADGALFKLAAEAYRIHLAHLFDPVLAVHTSLVEPLPHQITGVYGEMLPQQPLRFLLADDPGAGKTIMAGLLIKELVVRGDVQRCLICVPGNLANQWQDELWFKFQLRFEILTRESCETAVSGNPFLEKDRIIVRLDQVARNEGLQEKLAHTDWDLVIVDEAHKMSAHYWGGELEETRRYKLGKVLRDITRHLLLMTATPHNGKEEDFQLFLALLDADRFEGRFREGVHQVEISDLMRRMVKEDLYRFDGHKLFPERRAYTVSYPLSLDEQRLYVAVTEYVRTEFNRAEQLQDDRRKGTVGFALTILQRRLASSPEAIYQSLRRRRERLEKRLAETRSADAEGRDPMYDTAYLEDLDDAPAVEVETVEAEILDNATTALTIAELQAEIATLRVLEAMAYQVRCSGTDRKWEELASIIQDDLRSTDRVRMTDVTGQRRKMVIFTEHLDTLRYLRDRISTLFGREEMLVTIHGGVPREERRAIEDRFRNDPDVIFLLATDAAGEGINLQRAHLMVNYDLPWNPNRIEQRFGRIHRIGQTEVCHLWNLVADETREGDVYRRLLDKLEEARTALGGQVFDVLGKLQFEGKPLRDLLIAAIRYGDQPEVRARLEKAIENGVDRPRLQELLEDRALARDTMDAGRVFRVREEMERAEARRLQPHYIESFFLEAFRRLGGATRQREPRRYEITHVPAPVRNRDRQIGMGEPVLARYERVAFEKNLIAPQGQPMAAFVCPGHPLLDAVLDLTLERHRDLLKRGAVLVDARDTGTEPRVLFFLEHAIQDASVLPSGDRRTISRRMLYVEMDAQANTRHLHYAPYLDYRPLEEEEPGIKDLLAQPECAWITRALEQKAQGYAIAEVVPGHIKEVRDRRLDWIAKTRAAVKERLTKEIAYWDHRAEQLKLQEQAGKAGARLNSQEARRRADDLQARLQKRLAELDREAQISALPPVVLGGVVVAPLGLLARMQGKAPDLATEAKKADTQAAAARARAIVMDIEKGLGYEPVDREFERLGYDIESRVPDEGRLRIIEVKGRVTGADTVTVTKNEIHYSLNKPDDFILALVEFLDEGNHRVKYLRRPFQREPDFGVTSVNYDFGELLARGEEPG